MSSQQLKRSKTNNPQISATVQKQQLKRVDEQVHTMKNRVQLLRQQLQKEKQSIKKNKNMVKDVIEKKIEVNRINQLKQKDTSQEDRKIEELRARNRSYRVNHQKELENIHKAIYLVKLDDAREVKNISLEHRRKIKDMDRDFLSAQKEKKKRVAEQSEKAKERYQKYWKQKLQSLYTQQAQTLVHTINEKQNKKKQLKALQQQEIRLLQEINKTHSIQVQSKKQYLAALSLPVKDVAEAMGDSPPKVRSSMVNSQMSINRSRYQDQPTERRSIDASGSRLPNTSVNQAKLKIILSQLKKMDKREANYSAKN